MPRGLRVLAAIMKPRSKKFAARREPRQFSWRYPEEADERHLAHMKGVSLKVAKLVLACAVCIGLVASVVLLLRALRGK